MREKHSFGDRNDNEERFVNFWIFTSLGFLVHSSSTELAIESVGFGSLGFNIMRGQVFQCLVNKL